MRVVALLVVLGACVHVPSHVDVAGLVARRGVVEAHRELVSRVLADPRDVGARLALAELADRTGRPAEAIEELEAVVRLGGPLGTRWHDADRMRLARLLVARGRVRLARRATTALADLERARSLGAQPTAAELTSARVAIAFEQLRHVDAKVRAQGRATLAAQRDLAWAGAAPTASPSERGSFGAWLWSIGARREAYEQLATWHAATPAPRDPALQAAYLRALAWWSPLWLGDRSSPPPSDLVGPERCWFPGTSCTPPVPPAPPLPQVVALAVGASPQAAAAARYAATRFATDPRRLAPIATAFTRDPAIAERLGREHVDAAADAALAHAELGALFDVLGDPARARAAWQAAVDASPEPVFVRGLAESAARSGDGPAALVFGTRAAAAWGDPAIVWTSVAAALVASNRLVDALTACRNALDLAGPEVLPAALDHAITASRGLHRTDQADSLLVQRALIAPQYSDEAKSALHAHVQQPTAVTVARLWVASRAYPRDLELRTALLQSLDADDTRRPTILEELLLLAGDPDPVRALTAATALR